MLKVKPRATTGNRPPVTVHFDPVGAARLTRGADHDPLIHFLAQVLATSLRNIPMKASSSSGNVRRQNEQSQAKSVIDTLVNPRDLELSKKLIVAHLRKTAASVGLSEQKIDEMGGLLADGKPNHQGLHSFRELLADHQKLNSRMLVRILPVLGLSLDQLFCDAVLSRKLTFDDVEALISISPLEGKEHLAPMFRARWESEKNLQARFLLSVITRFVSALDTDYQTKFEEFKVAEVPKSPLRVVLEVDTRDCEPGSKVGLV
jgi:hypothetical protein